MVKEMFEDIQVKFTTNIDWIGIRRKCKKVNKYSKLQYQMINLLEIIKY